MEVKVFGEVQKGYFSKSQNDKTMLTFSVYLRDNDYLCTKIIKTSNYEYLKTNCNVNCYACGGIGLGGCCRRRKGN